MLEDLMNNLSLTWPFVWARNYQYRAGQEVETAPIETRSIVNKFMAQNLRDSTRQCKMSSHGFFEFWVHDRFISQLPHSPRFMPLLPHLPSVPSCSVSLLLLTLHLHSDKRKMEWRCRQCCPNVRKFSIYCFTRSPSPLSSVRKHCVNIDM